MLANSPRYVITSYSIHYTKLYEKGIQTVAVTAGYIHAEPRREFFSRIDAANVDLKAFTRNNFV